MRCASLQGQTGEGQRLVKAWSGGECHFASPSHPIPSLTLPYPRHAHTHTHTQVAVKIIHPHVREKVEIDFYLMDKFASLIEALPGLNAQFLSIKDSVEQFRLIMYPQLDLRCEANNINKFDVNFADDECVTFPKPVMSHVTSNVLTEQFLEGTPILEFMKDKHSQKEKTQLAVLGIVTSLKMIFEHDFVHGDMHPGNILVDKNKNGEYRMNLLDCGIVVEMGEDDHKNLVQILGGERAKRVRRNGYRRLHPLLN